MSDANAWDLETVIHFARERHGLSGESRYEWPAEYLATHIVPNGGVCPIGGDKERAVREALRLGLVERREKTIHVPAETRYVKRPAYVIHMATYHATEKGLGAFVSGRYY